MMCRPLAIFALASMIFTGAEALAQSDGGSAPAAGVAAPPGFERGSVAHLAALCAATPENPRREAATGLCYGFLVGVGQYYAALHPAGSTRPPLFCLPNPAPSLETVAAAFVAWSQASPQYARERAVDGVMRWARQAYPCTPASGSAPDRGRMR